MKVQYLVICHDNTTGETLSGVKDVDERQARQSIGRKGDHYIPLDDESKAVYEDELAILNGSKVETTGDKPKNADKKPRKPRKTPEDKGTPLNEPPPEADADEEDIEGDDGESDGADESDE